jgi:hypothetical protein
MRNPGNYGFIPHTLSDDGDPCDVIVAGLPGVGVAALMSCKAVGCTTFASVLTLELMATNQYSSKYSSEFARLERRLPCRKCYNWEP